MTLENKILNKVRLDKYLWAIRIFKTRSMASTACDNGKVSCEGRKLKASYSVKINDVFTIKISSEITRIIEVKVLVEKRESAKQAQQYFIDHSPKPTHNNEKLPSAFYEPQGKREKGSGRPSKKEGRIIRSTFNF